MAYSYYHNANYTHASKSVLEDSSDTSTLKALGATASALSYDSYPSYDSAEVYAAVLSNNAISYKYVKDTGNGDHVVSGW